MSRVKDLTGQRFGRLVALGCVGRTKHQKSVWRCQCDCGNTVGVVAGSLNSGNTRSCGCLKDEWENPNASQYEGKRFGRLVVLERAANTKNGQTRWLCACDCGGTTISTQYDLAGGYTKSCGCYKRDLTIARNTTHSLSQHPLYQVWRGMKKRCQNPNNSGYQYYGARGIYVCEEWDNDFMAFYEFVMDLGWEHGLTIDRIDNDGPYCPENLRVVDYYTQARNRSDNVIVEIDGEEMCLSEAVERFSSIRYQTVWMRIFYQEMTVEDALFTPLRTNQFG